VQVIIFLCTLLHTQVRFSLICLYDMRVGAHFTQVLARHDNTNHCVPFYQYIDVIHLSAFYLKKVFLSRQYFAEHQ